MFKVIGTLFRLSKNENLIAEMEKRLTETSDKCDTANQNYNHLIGLIQKLEKKQIEIKETITATDKQLDLILEKNLTVKAEITDYIANFDGKLAESVNMAKGHIENVSEIVGKCDAKIIELNDALSKMTEQVCELQR